uniref:EF-hand domain-containing protein n=1 Tax=Magallana gigas TaxID=29159 RepID=A0A8W8J0Y1_MAGGI
MSADLPDIEDMKEVFDLFDFWDGRDGLIDAVKVGDLLRCCGLNPTNALIYKNDEELEDILQSIDLDVDYEGNIKYEDFIKKVMKGPPEGKPEFTY